MERLLVSSCDFDLYSRPVHRCQKMPRSAVATRLLFQSCGDHRPRFRRDSGTAPSGPRSQRRTSSSSEIAIESFARVRASDCLALRAAPAARCCALVRRRLPVCMERTSGPRNCRNDRVDMLPCDDAIARRRSRFYSVFPRKDTLHHKRQHTQKTRLDRFAPPHVSSRTTTRD